MDKFDEYHKQLIYSDDNDNNVKCSTCDVHIPNVEENIIQHMRGRSHNKNITYKKKLEVFYKKLSFTDDANTEAMCIVCNVSIPFVEHNILRHMEGRKHREMLVYKKKVNAYCKQLRFNDDEKTQANCVVCEVSIPFLEQEIVNYMEGKRHEQIIMNIHTKKKIDVFFKLLVDDNKNEVKCKICNVNVPNVNENITEHKESIIHTKRIHQLLIYHKMRVTQQGYYCECCGISTPYFIDHINSNEHLNNHRMNIDTDKRLFLKYVYGNGVYLNNVKYLKKKKRMCNRRGKRGNSRHIRTKNRGKTTKYEINLLSGGEISEVKETRFYCEICCGELKKVSKIDHVLNQKHILLEIQEKEWLIEKRIMKKILKKEPEPMKVELINRESMNTESMENEELKEKKNKKKKLKKKESSKKETKKNELKKLLEESMKEKLRKELMEKSMEMRRVFTVDLYSYLSNSRHCVFSYF